MVISFFSVFTGVAYYLVGYAFAFGEGKGFIEHSNFADSYLLTLKAPITTVADDKYCVFIPNFQKKKVWYYMRIVCQQTSLTKYHALFVIFEKAAKIWNCCLLQI